MVLFYTWNLKNVTCLFLIPQTSLLCEFCVLPPEKSLTLNIFLEYCHHSPVLWVKMNYFGIFPPLKPSQPMLTSFPPMSYLPWDLKGKFTSFFGCSLWPLFVSFSSSSKLGGQTDTTQHYWPLVFRLQQITLCPDHTFPSELYCPSLNQKSPFQMTFRLCASLVLLTSLSSTQPHLSLTGCFSVSPCPGNCQH